MEIKEEIEDILEEEIMTREEIIEEEENLEGVIENEDNEIVDYNILKKITEFEMEKYVCKIVLEEKIKGKLICISGTGFFCDISSKKLKVFITNNHVLDQKFLDNSKRLTFFIQQENNEIKKEIDLEINRFKLTNKDLDFTIIEILEEDKIEHFLEIDEFVHSKNYINQQIFSFQFPLGKQLKYSHGKIITKKGNYYVYSAGTLRGSSGSPILLYNNLKLIGLHKGGINKKEQINVGIPINLIINKIDCIKCVYNINIDALGQEVQLINYECYKNGFKKRNEELKKNLKIIINGKIEPIIFKYRFIKEGKYNIYFLKENPISNISNLFSECKNLEEINLSPFNSEEVTSMMHMFYQCESLKKIDFFSFNTNNVTTMEGLFYFCSLLKEIDLSSFKTENVTSMENMFSCCKSLEKIKFSTSFDTSKVNSMKGMFEYCESLDSIELSFFKTENVTDMTDMFYFCKKLKDINLLSFNTNNVISMENMFSGLNNIEEINLSSFTSPNLKNICNMFAQCYKLKKLTLSPLFNIKNVTYMSSLFWDCRNLKEIINLAFETDNADSMENMFRHCSSLEEIDLSSFKTTNLKIMKKMFAYCQSLKHVNLSSFQTDKVLNMEDMFNNCKSLKEVDLSNFDTSNIINMSNMFKECTSIKKINIDSFITKKSTKISNMFEKVPRTAELICKDQKILNQFKEDTKCIVF